MTAIAELQKRVGAVLALAPVVPVLVIDDLAHAVPLARALVAGGLPAIEVTLRTPVALEAVRAIAADCGLPLNLLARAALPPAAQLRDWGVRRLSAGSDLAQSAHALTRRLAAGFLHDGDSQPLAAAAMGYGELNALFEPR